MAENTGKVWAEKVKKDPHIFTSSLPEGFMKSPQPTRDLYPSHTYISELNCREAFDYGFAKVYGKDTYEGVYRHFKLGSEPQGRYFEHPTADRIEMEMQFLAGERKKEHMREDSGIRLNVISLSSATAKAGEIILGVKTPD